MYSNGFMIDRLMKQKEEIENLIKNYQNTQAPVNNFINTSQANDKNLIEWRILNENEEVDNLYVQNKTLFVNDNLMVLKGVDGSLEKWKITKIWPVDKKDAKISELEEEIKKLKEVLNEHTKPNESITECEQPATDDDGNANRKSKTSSRPIQKQE